MHLKPASTAFRKDLVEPDVHPQIARHVVAICAKHDSRCQPVAQILYGCVVKQDIDVGCQNKITMGTANADILADHLK